MNRCPENVSPYILAAAERAKLPISVEWLASSSAVGGSAFRICRLDKANIGFTRTCADATRAYLDLCRALLPDAAKLAPGSSHDGPGVLCDGGRNV